MIDALIIDDNRQLADVMCLMLDMLGCKGRAAYGARSGLMELNEQKPDVVFLDISMPGVDGFEVYSYIRRIPGCEQVPVIVVTSDDQMTTARRVDAIGAAGMIIKPVTLDLIEDALKSVGLLV